MDLQEELESLVTELKNREGDIAAIMPRFSGETVPLYENARAKYALARAQALGSLAALQLGGAMKKQIATALKDL